MGQFVFIHLSSQPSPCSILVFISVWYQKEKSLQSFWQCSLSTQWIHVFFCFTLLTFLSVFFYLLRNKFSSTTWQIPWKLMPFRSYHVTLDAVDLFLTWQRPVEGWEAVNYTPCSSNSMQAATVHNVDMFWICWLYELHKDRELLRIITFQVFSRYYQKHPRYTVVHFRQWKKSNKQI